MSFLKKLFSSGKLDGEALAQSTQLTEYAQIDLLTQFAQPRPRHDEREIRLWERVLPRGYAEQLNLFQKQGWLQVQGEQYQTTATAASVLTSYQTRQARQKQEARQKVRQTLQSRDTSEALAIRRRYESLQPLGKADWTGPEPQLSHSALTRRILFLQHWLLDNLSAQTQEWLKLYAAEQHLWGATWRLSINEIPDTVAQELSSPHLDPAEAAYWKAHTLALYVENQETWQRCKGGDHVRRIEITGPDDEFVCEHCRQFRGEQYLVVRVPELPHRECSSPYGCRCEYTPVLDMYEELPE